ncbi:MAG: carboxymuconolactone decarboxylase family protein [Clostridia bacterium]|nr:carboxymuconolactone decarboxylase family protein [Clostridia bacterium]
MKKSIFKRIISMALMFTVGIMPAVNVYAEPLTNGSELTEMMNHYGSEYIDKHLDTRTQQLIILSAMTALQAYSQIKEQVKTALNSGVTPAEIKEAVYQAAPYCGYTKALSAMESVDEVFNERKIPIIESQSTVNENNRYEKGLEVQRSIFGPEIGTITDDMTDSQKVITKYLSGICFGDFYTRSTLDVKTRELLTLSVLTANGGCESQIGSHTNGNLTVGNTRDQMLAAVLLCVPYNGYPRTLNAMNAINTAADAYEANKK